MAPFLPSPPFRTGRRPPALPPAPGRFPEVPWLPRAASICLPGGFLAAVLLCPWVTHLCPRPSGLQRLPVNVYRALQRADYCSGWFYPGYLADPHSGSVAPCHTWETEVGDVEVSGPAVLVGLILSSAFWHHPRAGLVVTVGARCWPVRPGVPLSILRCLGRSTQVSRPPRPGGGDTLPQASCRGQVRICTQRLASGFRLVRTANSPGGCSSVHPSTVHPSTPSFHSSRGLSQGAQVQTAVRWA